MIVVLYKCRAVFFWEEYMEYSGTWKEIWTQKGAMEGTKEDIRVFDGWKNLLQI